MKRLGDVLLTGLYLLLFGLYIAGIIHSNKKHSDNFVLNYSPLAIYRGVEMFWHDDYAGVDWKEKVNEDINTAIRLVSATTQTYDLVNTKQQIDEFAAQLKEYPNEKRKEVANGVRLFINFGNLWTKDMIFHLENTDIVTAFSFSEKTQSAYDKLKKDYTFPEVTEMKNVADSIVSELLANPENRQMYIDRIKAHDVQDQSLYQRYFYKMFGENL